MNATLPTHAMLASAIVIVAVPVPRAWALGDDLHWQPVIDGALIAGQSARIARAQAARPPSEVLAEVLARWHAEGAGPVREFRSGEWQGVSRVTAQGLEWVQVRQSANSATELLRTHLKLAAAGTPLERPVDGSWPTRLAPQTHLVRLLETRHADGLVSVIGWSTDGTPAQALADVEARAAGLGVQTRRVVARASASGGALALVGAWRAGEFAVVAQPTTGGARVALLHAARGRAVSAVREAGK